MHGVKLGRLTSSPIKEQGGAKPTSSSAAGLKLGAGDSKFVVSQDVLVNLAWNPGFDTAQQSSPKLTPGDIAASEYHMNCSA